MKYIIPYYLFINEASSKEIIQHWKSKIPPKALDFFKRIVDNNVQFLDKMCQLYTQTKSSTDLIVPFASITKAKKLNDPLANKIKPDDIQNLTNLISLAKPFVDNDIYYAANTTSYKKYGSLTYKKLQDDDNVLLVSYYSVADGVYFGDRRGWCTGDTTKAMFDDGFYTKDYISKGDIYFIVDKKLYNKNPKDKAACMQLSIKDNGDYEFLGQDNKKVTKSSTIFKDYLKKLGVDMTKIPTPDDLLNMANFHPSIRPFLNKLPLNNRQKSLLNVTPDGKKIIIDKPIKPDFLNFDCDVKTFLDNTQFDKIILDLEHRTPDKYRLINELIYNNVKIEFINQVDYVNIKLTDTYSLNDYIFNDYIKGDFNCDSNNLTSLYGAPKIVNKNFYCSNNNLTSLKYAPKYVNSFDCSYNEITSLNDAPKTVNGDFDCSYNKLTSLIGAPEYIGGYFFCAHNNLDSLSGLPKKIGGPLVLYDNEITSLKGVPKIINGYFNCSKNELKSLDYSPIKIDGDFDCSENKLYNIDGIPKIINGNFYISKTCPIVKVLIGEYRDKYNANDYMETQYVEKYIRSLSNIKGNVILDNY